MREEAERLQLDGFLVKPVTKSMIVDTISYDPTTKDLSVEVTKAKAASPDILLVVSRRRWAALP